MRKGRKPLRLERLEDRLALSCSASIVDGMLMIEGDKGDNAIAVTINGDSVSVSCDDFSETFSASQFSGIRVEGGKGNDTLNVLINDVATQLALEVDGGMGNDTVNVTTGGFTLDAGETLDIRVEGGRDADSVTFRANGTVINGTADVTVEGGPGADTILLAGRATVNRTGRLRVRAEGGPGPTR
jgi:hypothetical protein